MAIAQHELAAAPAHGTGEVEPELPTGEPWAGHVVEERTHPITRAAVRPGRVEPQAGDQICPRPTADNLAIDDVRPRSAERATRAEGVVAAEAAPEVVALAAAVDDVRPGIAQEPVGTEPTGHVLEAGEGIGLSVGATASGAQVNGDRCAA